MKQPSFELFCGEPEGSKRIFSLKNTSSVMVSNIHLVAFDLYNYGNAKDSLLLSGRYFPTSLASNEEKVFEFENIRLKERNVGYRYFELVFTAEDDELNVYQCKVTKNVENIYDKTYITGRWDDIKVSELKTGEKTGDDLAKNLLTREIYSILDGDSFFDSYTAKSGKQIRIGLPGLSGPTLCDISTKFGKPETYPWNGGALSRWAYVEGVLKHCIENGTWSTLIKYLCSRPQFRDVLKDLDFEEAEEAYRQSITAAIDGINKILLFSGSQLVYQDGDFKVIASNRTASTGDEVLDSIFKQGKPNAFSSIQEYEQCEKLGEGGFGTVYRYHNSNLDMDFAIKIYHPWFVSDVEREEGEKRFFREAKMLFSLNHPNIVRIYDAGRINGEPFIRMELIKGKSLEAFRDSVGNLKPVYALKAIRQILSGLECAHASGVIHRDLKPSNIMVGEDSPKYRCVIIDFGISAFMETEGYTRLTKTGEKIAGGQFIDPRLMENPKLRDPRSDIYSVGAILYFLLCGRAPVGSDMKEYLLSSNHDIDEEALALIMKSLASDLDDRYTSCADFINAIDNCLTSYKKV